MSQQKGFLYSVVHETQKNNKLKMRMSALNDIQPASSPPVWYPPSNQICLAAIGDLSKTTRQFRESLNGNSDNFSACPAPWDDEYLALHGTEEGEDGQTYDEWMALLPEPESEIKEPPPSDSYRHVKRHSVQELHQEYAAMTRNAPTPQQLWKKQEIKNAKKVRHEKMLLEGKSSVSELEPWTCGICQETGNASHSFTCSACGAAPVPIARTSSETKDHDQEQDSAMSQLRKRVPAGSGKSHLYIVPIGTDFPETISDAMFQCMQAYFYGQQVHILAPFGSTKEYLYDGDDLEDLILPHVEDPVVVRNRRAKQQQKRDARIASGKGKVVIPDRDKQVSADAVLNALDHKLKYDWHGADNAYVVIALTMSDLCDPGGVREQCECMERLDRKMENVRERQRKVAAQLRKAMMKGYKNKQMAAQIKATQLEEEKQQIIVEKEFQKIQLKKRATFVSDRTRGRVSVMSFYQYSPARKRTALSKNPGVGADLKVIVKRGSKFLVHKVCEMFGMAHCIYFHCRMNGSANTEQQDLSPMHLCPVCLRKLYQACGIHTTPRAIERYFQLALFTGGIYKSCFGEDTTRWFRGRAATIEKAL